MKRVHVGFRFFIAFSICVNSLSLESYEVNGNNYVSETQENHCASSPCKNGGNCTNDEDTYNCTCPDLFGEKDCSKNIWCDINGRATCGDVQCEYNATREEGDCICEDEKIFNEITKTCIENHCASNPCKNGGNCTNDEDTYNCTCPDFFGEKDCSKNIWCDINGRATCGDVKCEYNATRKKGDCICEDEKIFNRTTKSCIVDHCASSPCKNNGTCRNDEDAYQCDCKGIYGGAKCEDIIWCDKHGKELCGDVKCVNDKILKTGYCECEQHYQTFNNFSKTCEAMSGCIPKLLQGECGLPHEICNEKNVQCECENNYKYNSKKDACEANFCRTVKCGSYAKCNELGNGETLCVCNKEYFRDNNACRKIDHCIGKRCTQKCKDGKCACDEGFTLNKDDNVTCVAVKDESLCNDLNCGTGTCVKKSEKESMCICPSKFIFKNNTCIDICTNNGGEPPADTCPNKCEATNDVRGFRCKCENPYEQHENGIYCKRKNMCGERVAIEECEKEAAVCKENLSNTKGYDCVCGEGFEKEGNVCKQKCDIKSYRDKCTVLNAICELDEAQEVKCVCPPMITRDGNDDTKPCDRIAPHSYMGKLGVLKKLYELKDSRRSKRSLKIVNMTKLQQDMNDSLSKVYGKLDDLKIINCEDEENVLDCNIEMQLVNEAQTVNAIASPKVCVPINDEYCLVQPHLVLKREEDNNDFFEKTDPCSEEVKSKQCEEATSCTSTNNIDFQCKCETGFNTIGVYHPVKSNKTFVERCKDIDECEDPKACPATTNCVNTYGDYHCYCKDKHKKKSVNSDTKVEGCEALCSPSPCVNGTCVIVGNHGFSCKCKDSFTGIFCNETVTDKMDQRNVAIVGGVLGAILLIVLIAGYLFYRKVQNDKEEGEDDYTKHRQRGILTEMTRPGRRQIDRDNDIELQGRNRNSRFARQDSGEYRRGFQEERMIPRVQASRGRDENLDDRNASSDPEISRRPGQRELREERRNPRNVSNMQFRNRGYEEE